MEKKKVLLIAYYWPPAGGIAVRRWLGLANALTRKGVEVHVLTIDPKSAQYLQVDERLIDGIDPSITVHTVRAFNPFIFVNQLVPRRAIPGAAFSEGKSSGILGRILTVLRSHLFIPDPRKTWVKKAKRVGCDLVDGEGISCIITTSPPQSVQLIGLGIKKARRNVQWIADFRDPWTDIFYYDRLGHSALSRRIDASMERSVLESADHVLTVSWGFKELLIEKVRGSHKKKFLVLTNGMDFEPFVSQLPSIPNQATPFRIVYTGTIAPSYAPEPFLETIASINESEQHRPIILDYYGGISADYQEELESKFEFITFHGFVEQQNIEAIQRTADLLFLVSPEVEKGKGIIPGKIFEYMGTLNPIVYLGNPTDDVARILNETGSGFCLPRDDMFAIREDLVNILRAEFNQIDHGARLEKIQPYIRANQANRVYDLL